MAVTNLDYLFGLAMHGIKLGLGNIRALLEAADNPQDSVPLVHVGGTNGKGSTVALLHAMLRAAGYRTGRFTSPHLIALNERFQIDGVPISDADLDEQIAFFREIAAERDYPPTFFELNTAIAFRWFAQQQVNVALIEVGLGGRLDSTNVIHPIATAVTNIDLEHTQYLGDTLEEIAYEKAGIFKEGVPAVIGETAPAPRSVLLARARHVGAPALAVERDFCYAVSGTPRTQHISYQSPTLMIDDAPLSLHGRFQGANAAVAIALAEVCAPRFPALNRDTIVTGLASASWPCRMECVLENPPVYIDVAHNPAGARRLAELFDRCVVLLAVSSDKDADGILAALAPLAVQFVVTKYEGPRGMPVEQLAALAEGYALVDAAETVTEAIAKGLALASPEFPLLITGSIFLAGEARAILIDQFGAPNLCF